MLWQEEGPTTAETALPPPSDTPPAPALPHETAARRPSLDPATRRQTFLVAAVIAALFYGSQIVNEALPANARDQAPGQPVAIAGDVQITPQGAWVATPHENGSGVRLEKGVVVLDLYVEPFDGGADALASAYVEQVLRPGATQLTVSDIEFGATATVTAARLTYQGLFSGVDVAIEGEVTALFVDGQGVIADAWSGQGDLGRLLGEVHAMLETIEVPT